MQGGGLESAHTETILQRCADLPAQLCDRVGLCSCQHVSVCVNSLPMLITTYEVLCAFLNNSYHVKVVLHFNTRNCFALYFFNIRGFLDFYFMAKYTFVRTC